MGTRYILLLSLLCFALWGKAQTDTEFWFAVPEVSWRHVDPEPTYVHIAALDAAATVTIDMPQNATFAPTTFTIPANGAERLDLTWYVRTGYGAPPFDILNNAPTGTHDDNNIIESGLVGDEGNIENRGIRITSTSLITAYLERNATNNPDIWALKGKNALGTDFYVPSQNFWNNQPFSAPEALNAIDIVATEDTWVYFAPTAAVKNIGPGAANHSIVYSKYLLKGQSISLVATDEAAGAHLGGTHVWSDGKIAVSWKDDSVRSKLGGCYDLMGDQMIPTDLAGNEYVVMRGQLTTNREYVFIMSLSNGTIVDLADPDGLATGSITLGAPGSISRILLNNKNGTVNDPVPANPNGVIDALHLKSPNKEPFIVFHVTGFGCEMGTAVLPTIKGCTGSTEVSFQRSTSEGFFLNIMTKQAHIDDFFITINGTNYPIPGGWFTEIPGTGVDASSDWWYLDKTYNNFGAAHTVGTHGAAIPAVVTGAVTKVYNTTGIFHLGLINGGG
ncbi:MAG: hypothetical protein AB7E36_15800, partial [Salinivirgaceae bacterium]